MARHTIVKFHNSEFWGALFHYKWDESSHLQVFLSKGKFEVERLGVVFFDHKDALKKARAFVADLNGLTVRQVKYKIRKHKIV